MSKHDCQEYIDQFLSLDKGQRIPFKLRFHLLNCKECRSLVRLLTSAQKASIKSLNVPAPINTMTITRAIQEHDPNYVFKKEKKSLAAWTVTGIIFVAFLCLILITSTMISSETLRNYILFFFAFCICGYAALYVYQNLDFFVKVIDKNFITKIGGIA